MLLAQAILLVRATCRSLHCGAKDAPPVEMTVLRWFETKDEDAPPHL